MTNAEKFKEDFGFEPNKNACLNSERGKKCKHCGHWYKGVNVSECQAYKFWDDDYQGEPLIPLSVIEKITAEIQKEIDENLDSEGIPNEYAYCYESVLEIIDKAVKECTHDKG